MFPPGAFYSTPPPPHFLAPKSKYFWASKTISIERSFQSTNQIGEHFLINSQPPRIFFVFTGLYLHKCWLPEKQYKAEKYLVQFPEKNLPEEFLNVDLSMVPWQFLLFGLVVPCSSHKNNFPQRGCRGEGGKGSNLGQVNLSTCQDFHRIPELYITSCKYFSWAVASSGLEKGPRTVKVSCYFQKSTLMLLNFRRTN